MRDSKGESGMKQKAKKRKKENEWRSMMSQTLYLQLLRDTRPMPTVSICNLRCHRSSVNNPFLRIQMINSHADGN
jgi:hypothetical protein